MIPRKLNVYIGFASYAGNGGFKSEHPDVRDWLVKTAIQSTTDERIAEFQWKDLADTPISMVRNRHVLNARKVGADVLLMVDSDMAPDLYLGKVAGVKPFFSSSFDYLYRHFERGPVAICAPYCGPPPHPVTGGEECPYVFRYRTAESDSAQDSFKLSMYTREEAAQMAGIQACAAQPTGLIMFDMRMFELTEPRADETWHRGWFYYEFDDHFAASKSSTEDVTATRDMAIAARAKGWKYDPLLCNWDAWAGHHKPKCVGKPVLVGVNNISDRLVKAVRNDFDSRDKLVNVRSPIMDEIDAGNVHASNGKQFEEAIG